MDRSAYLAGCGLLCSQGDLAQTLHALREPPADAPAAEVAPGCHWPLHALPALPGAGDWQSQLAQGVRTVVAQAGIVPAPGAPLFLASSSLDIGYEEELACAGAPGFAGGLHSLGDAVARALGWPGPVFCFSTACTSAVQALLAARDGLRAGDFDEALVLGVEMPNRLTPAGFGALQLLSPDRARPFAAARNGLVPGQAVAAVHLRRAPARWRLGGGAHLIDGSQPTGAVPGAIEAAARAALAEAGCAPREVDLVKPQAAGSPGSDAAEAQALHALFGAQAVPPLIGFKSWIGHCMGASAAAELALLLACLDARAWPVAPMGDAQPDPALGLRWAEAPMAIAPRRVLFHAVGFGGGHGALLLEANAP